MKIASVKYGVDGGYEVTTLGGQIVHVPNDSQNNDCAKVDAWEADGGTITAADTAPAALTLTEVIAQRRSGDPVIDDLFTRMEAQEA